MRDQILVVDDQAEARDLMTFLLKRSSYEVLVADNGYQGIIIAAAENPDLIVADINMPFIDGIEMIKILRAEHKDRSVPIIAVTAFGTEAKEQAIRAGADYVLEKPFEPDMLLVVINQFLNRKKSKSNSACHH